MSARASRISPAPSSVAIVGSATFPAIYVSSNDSDFFVRFRLELDGGLWACIAGDWCFDIGFTPIGKGTGLGLRICRRILEEMGGRISAAKYHDVRVVARGHSRRARRRGRQLALPRKRRDGLGCVGVEDVWEV